MTNAVKVFETDQNITVMVMDTSTNTSVAVLNADFLPHKQYWWLARVFVQERYRGSGLGTLLLLRLQAALKNKPVDRVVVAPGGYGSDIDSLIRFYEKSGFRLIEPELLAWSSRDVQSKVDAVPTSQS